MIYFKSSKLNWTKDALYTINTPLKNRRQFHDVISISFFRRHRHKSDADEDDCEMGGVDDNDNDVEMMDETIAAMVLTSLSCSPKSPPFPQSFTGTSSITLINYTQCTVLCTLC